MRALNLGWIDDIMQHIEATIGGLLYRLLGGIFCKLLDWVQSIFRALAGLAPIKIGGEIVNAGDDKVDIVFYLVQTDVVQDIFWSMVTFSFILMFLMTGLAIIRNAYQDKPKSPTVIIGNVFKGLLGMILIPVACLVGLWFGNIILLAVDSATGANGAGHLSDTLFLSAAYDANIARAGGNIDSVSDAKKVKDRRAKNLLELCANTNFDDIMDDYGAGAYLNPTTSKMASWSQSDWDIIADAIDDAFVARAIIFNDGDVLEPYDSWQIENAYSCWNMNYIVFIVGGIIMLGFIFKMCFGMIGRIFKLTIDFVLIPVVMAMMPYDEGKASKSWKDDFVKNTVLAYGTVGALNLYFSILPIIDKIDFAAGDVKSFTGAAFFNFILRLILSIVGLFSAESIISTISGWFGTGDLIKEGTSTLDTYKKGLDKVKKPIDKVMGTTGKFIGGGLANAKGKKGFSAVGSFLSGGVGTTAGASLKKKYDDSAIIKGYSEGKKAGKEFAEAGGAGSFWPTEQGRKNAQSRAIARSGLTDLKKAVDKINSDTSLTADEKSEQIRKLYEESDFGKKLIEAGGELKTIDKNGTVHKEDLNPIKSDIARTEKEIEKANKFVSQTEAMISEDQDGNLKFKANLTEQAKLGFMTNKRTGAYIDATPHFTNKKIKWNEGGGDIEVQISALTKADLAKPIVQQELTKYFDNHMQEQDIVNIVNTAQSDVSSKQEFVKSRKEDLGKAIQTALEDMEGNNGNANNAKLSDLGKK